MREPLPVLHKRKNAMIEPSFPGCQWVQPVTVISRMVVMTLLRL